MSSYIPSDVPLSKLPDETLEKLMRDAAGEYRANHDFARWNGGEVRTYPSEAFIDFLSVDIRPNSRQAF